MTTEQHHKLLHFFHVLDHSGNGLLEEEDFTLVADNLANQTQLAPTAKARLVLKVNAYALFLQILDDLEKEEAAITPEEWLGFCESFVLVKTSDYVQSACDYLFLLFDQDGDGYIDEREYLDMFHAYDLYTVHAKKAFDLLDRNGDGKISREELHKAFNEFFYSSDVDAPGNWIFGDWRRDF